MQFFATLHVNWGIWIWITQISYKTVFTKSQNQRNAGPSIFTFLFIARFELCLNCACSLTISESKTENKRKFEFECPNLNTESKWNLALSSHWNAIHVVGNYSGAFRPNPRSFDTRFSRNSQAIG